jgi:hypothetical protein
VFVKIFPSIFDGTLLGDWQAIVTLQQMLILCDQSGVIDMTPQALSARTSIPLDIIINGIRSLEAPDPHSRTPGEDGRRIVLLDAHRPWGWRIVNYLKYRNLKNMEQKREADRVRIAAKRNAKKSGDVATCRSVSQPVADVAQAEAEAEVSTTAAAQPSLIPAQPDTFETALREYPRRAGGNPKPKALKAWKARLSEGHTVDELQAGVCRYAAFVRATGKEGTEYVQQAATFFGPGKGFLEAWAPPEPRVAAVGGKSGAAW